MKKIATALLCFFFLNTKHVFAQAGNLDNAFSSDGTTLTTFNSLNCYGRAIAVQADGKILVAGDTKLPDLTFDFAICRYNTDGTPDNTFNGTGQVLTDLSAGSNDVSEAIAIDGNGKIVVAGYSYSLISFGYDFSMARYNTDGSLDLNFGVNGIVTTAIGSFDDVANAIAIQSDGNILLAGSTSNSTSTDIAVVRYQANGSLDNTFGTNGIVTTDFTGTDDAANAIALQSDGKILVAGSTRVGTANNFAIVRYNANGTLDNTFSTDGLVTAPIVTQDVAYGIALQTDGKIVLGGTSNGATPEFALARFNADGSFDNTFSSDGKLSVSFGVDPSDCFALALQPDGKILAVGSYGSNPNQKFAVARVSANGTLDNTFSSDGKTTTDIANGPDVADCIALQSDGKIVVAGYSANNNTNDFSIARYLSELNIGIVDFSLVDNAVLVYPNPVENGVQLDYTLKTDEKLSMDLYDAAGRNAQSFFSEKNITSGKHHEELNLDKTLPDGNYLLVLSNGSKQVSIKIIKQ